jgi:hypothetical protein
MAGTIISNGIIKTGTKSFITPFLQGLQDELFGYLQNGIISTH